MFNSFRKAEPKYSVGDIVYYNRDGNFGDENDELLLIRKRNFKRCNGDSKKQWYYSGYVMKIIDSNESQGVSQVPIYNTTLFNAPERSIKGLESLLPKQ